MINDIVKIVKNTGNMIVANSKIGKTGYWDGTQFKAKADQVAHNTIINSLKRVDRTIPIISEEEPESFLDSRPAKYWLVDPIDGTASFAQGYSGFVTQIALIEKKQPVLAAIYAPKLDSLYTSVKGKGAYLNGKSLKLLNNKNLKTLIDNNPIPKGLTKEVYNSFSISKYVECGSISLKICKIADGTADLFVKNIEVKDWDIAAPQLILEEAGGFIRDIQGNAYLFDKQYANKGLIASYSLEKCIMVSDWYDRHYT